MKLARLVAAVLAASLAACSHGATKADPSPLAAATPAASGQQLDVSVPADVKPGADTISNQQPGRGELDAALARLQDVRVFFAFDEAALTPEAREKLAGVGEVLARFPALRITVEGHTDEWGTGDYNLALGQKRAAGVKEYLLAIGAQAGQVRTVSYGAERPLDTASTPEAWARNRRAELLGGQQ